MTRMPFLAPVAASAAFFVLMGCQTPPAADFGPLVAKLKQEEGFRRYAYRDSRGFLTIGFGTNIGIHRGISKAEAEWLLRERLEATWRDLRKAWPPVVSLPTAAQMAVLDAGYTLGVAGLLQFHKMLGHLEKKEWAQAAEEAELSKWAIETPKRAQRVADVFRRLEK